MTQTQLARDATAAAHAREVERGERFPFGENWSRFLRLLDEERIAQAERSLTDMLRTTDLRGRSFVDVGSGSGLFSLAARRLGARVHSFDYDPASVACTRELRRRYFPDDSEWRVERGSVTDPDYLRSLGRFDVVYSWGVLHHTGAMWRALECVTELVAPRGLLYVAIYNDQGAWSRRWLSIKRLYCSGLLGKALVTGTVIPAWVARDFLADVVWRRSPIARYAEYKRNRGMSVVHDWLDWLGGYPFEVAKPEEVFEFYRARSFELVRLRTAGGTPGCNEFVFRRYEPEAEGERRAAAGTEAGARAARAIGAAA
jgi:2-polyprenyl-3-methyl-5-hydroxy-6-metoxy-1,4-benzoquinol methylase